MLRLTQTQRLQQKLSPVQVQYLKILQLPVLALEQRIKDELEQNPCLEEAIEQEETQEETSELREEELSSNGEEGAEIEPDAITAEPEPSNEEDYIEKEIREHQDEEYSWEEFFENNEGSYSKTWYDQDDDREIPTPAYATFSERLIDQLHMLEIDERLIVLGEEIIGNVDDDGYLRRDLEDILSDFNLERGTDFTLEEAETILYHIQRLEPPGVGSRDLRECLLIQLDLIKNKSTPQIIAQRILKESYDLFVRKHFDKIQNELHISEDMLKKAFEVIKRLNPKPGEGNIAPALNYIIPDFIITRERDDFIITLNDRGVPPLKVSKAYREMLLNKSTGLSSETKQFLRQKMDSAKWFIQSIYQRRHTLLSVMETIVQKQSDWFEKGPGNLKPLIYRDVADVIGMDISTISRVVNGKYAQTEWGVVELKYFFSEGIPTMSGVEVSNKEVKNLIKEIIAEEDPKKPLSDEAIMKILREKGFDIARRTVAKYREALGIPVSRLRISI